MDRGGDTSTRSVFDQAADLLLDEAASAAAHGAPEAIGLLESLDYALDPTRSNAAEKKHRAALLRVAARLARIFKLQALAAPGLVILGGEADPARALGPQWRGQPVGSVTGTGLALRAAFESCVGEAVEYLSQFEAPGDIVDARASTFPRPSVFAEAVPHWEPPTDRGFVRARRLGDDTEVLLPADRCLRRTEQRALAPPFALSTGCAAGGSREEAMLHGLLELIERDAAALWWRGGRSGRPLYLEVAASRDGIAMLAVLRQERRERHTWMLDITTDVEVPCIAAISVDRVGRRFACGLAARVTMTSAVQAALREMCQMELALDVVAAKRAERGDTALNKTDLRHLERAETINAACPILHPLGAPRDPDSPVALDPRADLAHVLQRLAAIDVEAYAVDLTRPALGIPMVRVVTPRLQLDPCAIVSERLRRVIADAETTSRYAYRPSIPLL